MLIHVDSFFFGRRADVKSLCEIMMILLIKTAKLSFVFKAAGLDRQWIEAQPAPAKP